MAKTLTYSQKSLSILILQDGFSFLVKDELHHPLTFNAYTFKKSESSFEILKHIKSQIHTSFIKDNSIETLDVINANPLVWFQRLILMILIFRII